MEGNRNLGDQRIWLLRMQSAKNKGQKAHVRERIKKATAAMRHV